MSEISQRERELLNELAALRRRIAREETKEFSGSAGSVSTFLALTDTPSSFAGAANYFVRVNAGTSALVFGTVDWGDIYNIPIAGTATRGIAAFTSSNFTVSGGTVSLGTVYPRYSGVPTAGAMAYWTGNGTIAAAGFGTSTVAQYSGTQSAGVFAYFTGTGTVTASAAYGTATMPIFNGAPAANDMAYWNSSNRLTNAPFGTADVVRTSDAQSIAGAKTFSSSIAVSLGAASGSVGVSSTGSATAATLSVANGGAIGQINAYGTAVGVGLGGNVAFGGLSNDFVIHVDGDVASGGTHSIQFRTGGYNTNQERARITTTGVAIGATTNSATLHVDQSSTTAAIPVLLLDQADLSEEFIEFVTTVGAGNPIDTAAIGTYYGKVRVNVSGVGYKYLALYNT